MLNEEIRSTVFSYMSGIITNQGHKSIIINGMADHVHLLIGFRRLREVDYYRDDPLVLRLLGLKKLPDVSTISRALSQMEDEGVDNYRQLSRDLVTEGLIRERFPRLTLDFDGSVITTKGHAEGTAVGFNKVKKGGRSYYPLFCTVAQTGQFFDLLHRPGNVHDSNGADEFMLMCFENLRAKLNGTIFESRMDSAFFSKKVMSVFDDNHVKFTASVPFERLTELTSERRQRVRSVEGRSSRRAAGVSRSRSSYKGLSSACHCRRSRTGS